MEEAVEWLKRAPFDGGTEIEIRPVFEAEDFGKEFTPELRAQEERLRAADRRKAEVIGRGGAIRRASQAEAIEMPLHPWRNTRTMPLPGFAHEDDRQRAIAAGASRQPLGPR